MDYEIRLAYPSDMGRLSALYASAFPEEDLATLVQALLAYGPDVAAFVAQRDGALLGHACLTTCSVSVSAQTVGLLGPVAVTPERQRSGIGTRLIKYAIDHATQAGASAVCVLGDPGFYQRFGFRRETSITTPYPIPSVWADAWQSLRTSPDRVIAGQLHVPVPWQDQGLWS